MKKSFVTIGVLALLAAMVGVFGYINQEKLIDRFVQSQSNDSAFDYELLEDSLVLKLITVGTASPIPGPRVQSCNVIIANGRLFIFDVGANSEKKMERMKIPIDKIEAVFISHWHSDHFIDLPQLINRSWLLGRRHSLKVYGPEPVDSIVYHTNEMLKTEQHYKVMRHGEQLADTKIALATAESISFHEDSSTIVYDDYGIRITAFLVDHSPVEVSLGYRVDYLNKSIVLSGDTRKSNMLIKMSKDVDLLVHDALDVDLMTRAAKLQESKGNIRRATMIKNLIDYHASTVDAAESANEAQAKKLLLTHLCPSPENPISRRYFRSGLDKIYNGPILLAEDGDLFIIK